MHRRHFLGASAAALAAPRAAAADPFPVAMTQAQWRARLSPEAYAVLREGATEAAFSHPYHDETAPGTYRCAGCDSPVYASADKFASGTGWPAFDRAIPGQVREGRDAFFGIVPIEVACATCGGHLGHVFNDGPEATTGRRHCINGAALVLHRA
jgi:peptide-methionine (R)-S-oxide reductase